MNLLYYCRFYGTVCIYILTIGLLCNGVRASAQANPVITAYSVNEGLPQTSVDEFIQDKNGFLWIGTAGGLCRFDGYNFKLYKKGINSPGAVNSDRGFHFYNDSTGRLWMVNYAGITLYDSEKDNFKNLLSTDLHHVITSENKIFGEDNTYIWMGINEYGLTRVHKKTLRVEKVNFPGISNSKAPTSWYRGFLCKDQLWVLAQNSFYVCNTRTRQVRQVNIPASALINLNSDQAVAYGNGKLFFIDKRTLQYETIPVFTEKTAVSHLSTFSPATIVISSSTRGISYFNIRTKKIVNQISSIGQVPFEKVLSAVTSYTDRSGNLWVGTAGDGIYKVTYPFKKFHIYRSGDPKANSVFSIYADDKNVYTAGGNTGIDVFKRHGKFLKNVPVNRGAPQLLNRAFIAPALEAGTLMLSVYSSRNGGNNIPLLFNKSSATTQPLNKEVLDFYSKHWGQGNFRQFFFKDKDALLTNVGQYLVQLRNCGKRYCLDTIKQFRDEMLSCCFKDAAGNIWIGTYKGAYFLSNGKWNKIKLPYNAEIKSITQDLRKNIWLATNEGIFLLDRKHSVKKMFTEADGLSNDHVYALLRDNAGNIWFSHNKGISVYYHTKGKFSNFFAHDGLQAPEFNSGAYFKAADGELFFGGINGTTSFYPEEIERNPSVPAVQITGIQLFDKPFAPNGAAPWAISSITLPYTANSLSFDFALPEYTNSSANTYAYHMEGVDKKWTSSGRRRYSRYPALEPGNYVFKVKAANNDGIWGEETAIAITIIPPYWQRTWFVILAAVCGVAFVAVVVRAVYQQRYKRSMLAFEMQQRVQAERERISRDLHDNVGTQLSLISKHIEGVLNPSAGLEQPEKDQNLINISITSKEVIATLRETIWALNKEEVTFEEFSDKLRAYAQKQIKTYSSMQLVFKEPEDGEKTVLNASEAIHLFRICQEAISNALKYADAARLDIELTSHNDKYKIIIRDNGRGFDPSKVEQHANYGLENMKFRSAEIGCTMDIDTQKGGFTEIRLVKK